MPLRRTFLALVGLGGALAAATVGCSDEPSVRESTLRRIGTTERPPEPRGAVAGVERLTYGDDPSQFAELVRPEGRSRGVVVVIHGGFWRAEYDHTLGQPLARDLAGRGWTALNIEYRRVGNGGGLPQTFDDVAAAIDLLADVEGLDTSTVVTLGHSAGGHLATWAAARGRFARWQPERVPVTAVISQAGVLDLTEAHEQGLGGGAVETFLGRPPGPAYDEVDPSRQVPLSVPVFCVHARADDVVPLAQSLDYVQLAVDAGAKAVLIDVDGDHLTVIDPASPAWTSTLEILDSMG